MPNLKVISCLVKLQTWDSVMNWKCSLGCRCDVQDFPNRYYQRCKALRISRTSIFTQTTNLITPYLTDRFSIHEQKQMEKMKHARKSTKIEMTGQKENYTYLTNIWTKWKNFMNCVLLLWIKFNVLLSSNIHKTCYCSSKSLFVCT